MIWAICAAAFTGLATLFHLATIVTVAFRCRGKRVAGSVLGALPPVSLLRPVCGLDSYAQETLGSSFCLDYAHYEVVFCVSDRNDAAVPLVERLIAANPGVPARLLVGNDHASPNPKLNNLIKGWDAARHQWIVMADSNVLMPPDYLDRLLAQWRDDTGVVCSMPLGSRPANFWAELECAFLNTLQARFQLMAASVGRGFAQGKTMLFRRDVIDNAGGIRALAAETAEDAATTKIVRAAGLKVHLVDRPFEQPLGSRYAAEVWARQLRWARLRRISFVWLFVPEVISGSFFPALALAVAAPGFGIDAAIAVPALLAIWIGAEIGLARVAGWHWSPRLIPALLIRDLLLPVLWTGAWLGNGFVWRGTAMTANRTTARRANRQRSAAPVAAMRPERQFL